MKNVSVILNVVLLVAVIVLFVLHFSGNKPSSSSVAKEGQTTDSIAVLKDIAYVQIDSLISSYDLYHDLRTEFEKKGSQMEQSLTADARSFQKAVEDYQEKASKGLITRSQAQETEQRLGERQKKLEQKSQEMRQELAEEESVMMRQITEAVLEYVNRYNEAKKYSLILNTSALNTTVLYGHPGMDITGDLIKGLNDEYIQKRVTNK